MGWRFSMMEHLVISVLTGMELPRAGKRGISEYH
jgi:hypothetical protein